MTGKSPELGSAFELVSILSKLFRRVEEHSRSIDFSLTLVIASGLGRSRAFAAEQGILIGRVCNSFHSLSKQTTFSSSWRPRAPGALADNRQ